MFTEVATNIQKLIVRFPGGMGEVNSYLIKGDRGFTVIDTGTYSKEAIETWQSALKSGIEIEKVVLTHTHEDHIGLAKWFQQQVKVPVFVSKLGYQEMLKHRNLEQIIQQLDSLIKKHGGSDRLKKLKNNAFIYDFEPDGFFDTNEMIQLGNDLYEVIWTPGHAPDQYCFYHKHTEVMIVGDHILKDISPVIGLWTGEEQNLLEDYYHSLSIMKNYPTNIALPGHGDVIQALDVRVKELKERHDYRLEQVVEQVMNEPKTAKQVCEEMYGTSNNGLLFSPFLATLTWCLYLESNERVTRIERGGKIYFKAI